MPAPSMDELRTLIADAAGVGAGQVTQDSTLPDLGIESKEVPRLLQQLEQKYSVKMTQSELASTRNVGDFYRTLVARA